MGQITVSWIVFNDDWDRVVGNPVDAARGSATERYLDYVAASMCSFRTRHPQTDHQQRVWLVQISKEGLPADAIREGLQRRGVRQQYAVSVLGLPRIRSFIEAARAKADQCQSAGRLHEHLIFFVLKQCRSRWLGIFDPDIVFVSSGVVDRVFEHLGKNRGKWAASFVEPSKERPWQGKRVRSRERMHSVALFFDAPTLQKHLPLDRFLERPPSDQLQGIKDPKIVEHYRRTGFLDALSFLTEWLRHGLDDDRLVDLASILGHVHEGPRLTLVSDGLLHCKHRETGARRILKATLEAAGLADLDDPWVRGYLAALSDAEESPHSA
jgi:hypothetical protein